VPLLDAPLDLFLDDLPRSGAMNMALDEILARTCERPLLRAYRWAENAVSFGYFGRYRDVVASWPGRPIVRRWTGGGEVPHGSDFTYTLIVPGSGAFSRQPAAHTYREIHATLADLLPGVILAETNAPPGSAACFERPVLGDLLLDGKKIAGAAQRRGRFGLLHQGSIQTGGLPADFIAAWAARLSPQPRIFAAPTSALEAAEQLARTRYATAQWLHLR
jgi:lipoate-protein ligase A